MNGQFESVCESVFSEVESQAMDALDLPGCFRTRSHSYLRAIQAGYSQDDECIPVMTASDLTSTVRATTGNSTLPPCPFSQRRRHVWISALVGAGMPLFPGPFAVLISLSCCHICSGV